MGEPGQELRVALMHLDEVTVLAHELYDVDVLLIVALIDRLQRDCWQPQELREVISVLFLKMVLIERH